MTKCDACNQPWSFFKVLQRLFMMKAAMVCPHCDEKQYIKKDWKRIVVPILILLIVPILLFTVEMSVNVFLLIFSLAALTAFLYMFFTLRLSSVEDWNQN